MITMMEEIMTAKPYISQRDWLPKIILKRRYKEIYILLDNDEAGLEDARKLSESTGFTNLVLPDYGAKDCSDLFKLLNNVNEFKQVILSLEYRDWETDRKSVV